MNLFSRNRLIIISLLFIIMLLIVSLYTANARYTDAKKYVDKDLISLVTRFSHLNESLVNDYEWYIDEENNEPLYQYERDLIIILQDLERVYLAYGEELNSSQIRSEWFYLTTDLQQEIVADEAYNLFLDIHKQIQKLIDEHGLSGDELEDLDMTGDKRYEYIHDRWLEVFDEVRGLSFRH